MDFVVITEHPPNLCASANAMVRKQMTEGFPQLPNLAKSMGVEIAYVGIPVVDHKIFMVLKAPNFETARKFIVESGIMQTNTIHIYPVVSFDEAMGMVGSLVPIF